MKCPRCGMELRIREDDKFCHECGFPLNAYLGIWESEELKSFFLDVNLGVMLVNGREAKNVTAFSQHFETGKYGLTVNSDVSFKAVAPLSIEKEASLQVPECKGA